VKKPGPHPKSTTTSLGLMLSFKMSRSGGLMRLLIRLLSVKANLSGKRLWLRWLRENAGSDSFSVGVRLLPPAVKKELFLPDDLPDLISNKMNVRDDFALLHLLHLVGVRYRRSDCQRFSIPLINYENGCSFLEGSLD